MEGPETLYTISRKLLLLWNTVCKNNYIVIQEFGRHHKKHTAYFRKHYNEEVSLS
jgi:hypothetical protein